MEGGQRVGRMKRRRWEKGGEKERKGQRVEGWREGGREGDGEERERRESERER